jgi:hypothetical protein
MRRASMRLRPNPFARYANVMRHKEGGPDSFRLRQGQWRAIHEIDP